VGVSISIRRHGWNAAPWFRASATHAAANRERSPTIGEGAFHKYTPYVSEPLIVKLVVSHSLPVD
jgi:hypothetical protein